MELQTQIDTKKIEEIPNAVQLIDKLKNLIYDYDKNADLVLFGSRARSDWHEESDWDFLVLMDIEVTEKFKSDLRIKIFEEIELPLNEGIFIIVKNKIDWEENNNVTPLYYNISEEGIML